MQPSTPTECRQCPLRRRTAFRKLSGRELSFVSRFKTGELVVDPGVGILLENETNAHIFTVLEGSVYWHRRRTRRSRRILGFGLPGDLLGIESAFAIGMRNSVTALSATKLCVFDGGAVENLFREQPELALALTQKLMQSVNRQEDLRISLGLRSTLEGTAYLVLMLYDHAAEVGSTDNGLLNVPLSASHVADTLGVALHHAERALVRLQHDGLLECSPHGIDILDRKRLEEASRYERRADIVRSLL